MKIYHYHPQTKEYLGTSVADESPLEPGTYLIPAYATEQEPPQPQTNQAVIFEEEWHIVPDYRGVSAVEIDDNGVFIRSYKYQLGEQPTNNLILAEVPGSHFYKAVWKDGKWTEGLSEEEIAERMKPQPVPPDPIQQQLNAIRSDYDQAIMELTLLIATQQGV